MQEVISGKVFVLGDNIDTDQIIPAEHLVYSMEDPQERQKYGQFALSGVPLERSGLPDGNIPFVAEGRRKTDFPIIVAGKNFGCGSSREHAPFALQVAGVQAVVAVSYARIFYRNAVDGGFLIPFESLEDLTAALKTGDVVAIDTQENRIIKQESGEAWPLRPLGEVAAIVEAGGIFNFARTRFRERVEEGISG